MTIEGIARRLRNKFPGKFVTFKVVAVAWADGTITREVSIFHEALLGEIPCADLEDGIRLVRERLEKKGLREPGKPFTIEIGPPS